MFQMNFANRSLQTRGKVTIETTSDRGLLANVKPNTTRALTCANWPQIIGWGLFLKQRLILGTIVINMSATIFKNISKKKMHFNTAVLIDFC